MKFINGSMYSHAGGKICNLLNRFLHEIVGVMQAMKLTVFEVNVYFLLDELPKILFHTKLTSRNKQN
jgi:hypothetical protein